MSLKAILNLIDSLTAALKHPDKSTLYPHHSEMTHTTLVSGFKKNLSKYSKPTCTLVSFLSSCSFPLSSPPEDQREAAFPFTCTLFSPALWHTGQHPPTSLAFKFQDAGYLYPCWQWWLCWWTWIGKGLETSLNHSEPHGVSPMTFRHNHVNPFPLSWEYLLAARVAAFTPR